MDTSFFSSSTSTGKYWIFVQFIPLATIPRSVSIRTCALSARFWRRVLVNCLGRHGFYRYPCGYPYWLWISMWTSLLAVDIRIDVFISYGYPYGCPCYLLISILTFLIVVDIRVNKRCGYPCGYPLNCKYPCEK